ncbi:hypothetical protein C2S52_010494 [Perilla frutescens var. hirtella]|nr:hypothetical protein C2S52_010494 [Perilla frutescens var. hirtella]KAH6817332.1 hypothetical protein C2S51_000935 [Perilla frutescens var. frutescens]
MGTKGQQEAGESLLEVTMMPMIPRWATTSQRKALSRAWQKSPTIPAKAEGEVCDRAHNNPRVIERRRKETGHKKTNANYSRSNAP